MKWTSEDIWSVALNLDKYTLPPVHTDDEALRVLILFTYVWTVAVGFQGELFLLIQEFSHLVFNHAEVVGDM